MRASATRRHARPMADQGAVGAAEHTLSPILAQQDTGLARRVYRMMEADPRVACGRRATFEDHPLLGRTLRHQHLSRTRSRLAMEDLGTPMRRRGHPPFAPRPLPAKRPMTLAGDGIADRLRRHLSPLLPRHGLSRRLHGVLRRGRIAARATRALVSPVTISARRTAGDRSRGYGERQQPRLARRSKTMQFRANSPRSPFHRQATGGEDVAARRTHRCAREERGLRRQAVPTACTALAFGDGASCPRVLGLGARVSRVHRFYLLTMRGKRALGIRKVFGSGVARLVPGH